MYNIYVHIYPQPLLGGLHMRVIYFLFGPHPAESNSMNQRVDERGVLSELQKPDSQ